jgi:hypothetical protein
VPFEDAVGLIAAQSQGLSELVMRDPLLPVELDEERLPGLAVEVGSAP